MLRLLPKQARHEPLYYIQNPPTLASFYCDGHSQRRTCSGNNSGSGSFEFALVELAGASVELDEDVASHGSKGGGSRFGWAFGFGVASGPEGLKRQCKSPRQFDTSKSCGYFCNSRCIIPGGIRRAQTGQAATMTPFHRMCFSSDQRAQSPPGCRRATSAISVSNDLICKFRIPSSPGGTGTYSEHIV